MSLLCTAIVTRSGEIEIIDMLWIEKIYSPLFSLLLRGCEKASSYLQKHSSELGSKNSIEIFDTLFTYFFFEMALSEAFHS